MTDDTQTRNPTVLDLGVRQSVCWDGEPHSRSNGPGGNVDVFWLESDAGRFRVFPCVKCGGLAWEIEPADGGN